MCGIVGIYSKIGIDKGQVERATKIMEHRGPDNRGFFFDSMVALGHQRLSIIDLSEKGKQPMSNENGDMWIVYNGEVYNFQKIRAVLESKGHRFKSNTDSEVVLHSYEEWGEACVGIFNGMFAFAIWDDKNKKFFIARDRVGIKPLYYYFDENRFIFASEIKALLEFNIKRKINEKMLYDYFNYFILVGNETLFENIKTLTPGYYISISIKDNKIVKKKWYDFDYSEDMNNEEFAKQQFLELFEDSIRRRMISDVPLGVFLSGGLDSSAIVAVMKKFSDSENIKTFCVGSGEDVELKNARKVAQYFNTDHQEIFIEASEFEKKLHDMVWHYDMPISFAASVPLYFVSKLTKGKATVVLTGEGADELFAGYHRYARIMRAKKTSKIFRGFSFLKPLVKASDPRYQKNIDLLFKFNPDYITGLNVIIDKERENMFLEKTDFLRNQVMELMNEKQTSFLNKLLYLDFKSYLVELLMKQDKMSMAASIESRVPYLDYRIIEFASRLSPELKVYGGVGSGKYILKKAMQNFLPKEIIFQKKLGFPVPLERWFRNELDPFLKENLFSDSEALNYFDKRYIRSLIEKHKKKNCSLQLWALLNFKLWHDKFMIS
jgi:asparagine synthase (glutamine-hydrolysing)